MINCQFANKFFKCPHDAKVIIKGVCSNGHALEALMCAKHQELFVKAVFGDNDVSCDYCRNMKKPSPIRLISQTRIFG
jgi:hypothetical protein